MFKTENRENMFFLSEDSLSYVHVNQEIDIQRLIKPMYAAF